VWVLLQKVRERANKLGRNQAPSRAKAQLLELVRFFSEPGSHRSHYFAGARHQTDFYDGFAVLKSGDYSVFFRDRNIENRRLVWKANRILLFHWTKQLWVVHRYISPTKTSFLCIPQLQDSRKVRVSRGTPHYLGHPQSPDIPAFSFSMSALAR
jgi:hypothetical protein